jgi:very-short-patch-repair endonuclease
MDEKVARPDMLIADVSGRQHGVVSTDQLRRAGISDHAIRGRVISGRLHRLHRGVYAVGHAAPPPEGRWFAAVLALGGSQGGDGDSVLDYWAAAVSHRSAACLWGLLPATRGPADVIVRGDGGRARRSGIRVHRSLSLVPTDVTLRRGIPVTTPARTIADLRKAAAAPGGGAVSPRDLRKAIRQANVLGLPIGEEGGEDRTRSDLERDFLRLCRRHRLPPPDVNVRIGPHLVDFLWRERRLVVETDGYRYHRGRAAFQDDRGRDLELRRLGYEVLRLSERQVNEESDRVVETLSAMLERQARRSRGTSRR